MLSRSRDGFQNNSSELDWMNDKEKIWTAINSPFDSTISDVVASKLITLTDVFSEIVENHGFPEVIKFTKPKNELDEIVMELFIQTLSEEMGSNNYLSQMSEGECTGIGWVVRERNNKITRK